MDTVIKFLFVHWQRKLVALLAAITLWLFVNQSISETKTLTNIPIRIVNLPHDKTIQGLLPNGMLSRRITLVLTGSKEVVEELEPSDLEVLLDASTADADDWIVQISKKNLISLNPAIDLPRHISQVEHTSLVIKLCQLVTTKIPLIIAEPHGKPPIGYEYLDIWPQHLWQTISGPRDEVQKLKEQGLEVIFDLNDIVKGDLDALKTGPDGDEISFVVPKKWQHVYIPFRNAPEEFNDPEAQNLRIDFLRKEFLPIEKEIPIRLFYPLEDIENINPSSFSLALSDDIQNKYGINIFTKPLFAKEVSRLFIQVIQNSIEIVIRAAPKNKRKVLAWSLEFINPSDLEDAYVAQFIASSPNRSLSISKKQEEVLRRRFRDYMYKLTLYLPNAKKLHLKSTLEDGQIRVVAY